MEHHRPPDSGCRRQASQLRRDQRAPWKDGSQFRRWRQRRLDPHQLPGLQRDARPHRDQQLDLQRVLRHRSRRHIRAGGSGGKHRAGGQRRGRLPAPLGQSVRLRCRRVPEIDRRRPVQHQRASAGFLHPRHPVGPGAGNRHGRQPSRCRQHADLQQRLAAAWCDVLVRDRVQPLRWPHGKRRLRPGDGSRARPGVTRHGRRPTRIQTDRLEFSVNPADGVLQPLHLRPATIAQRQHAGLLRRQRTPLRSHARGRGRVGIRQPGWRPYRRQLRHPYRHDRCGRRTVQLAVQVRALPDGLPRA